MNAKVLLYHGSLGGVVSGCANWSKAFSDQQPLEVKEALRWRCTVMTRLLWYSKARRRAVLNDKAILAPLTHKCHTKPSSKQSLFLTGMQVT